MCSTNIMISIHNIKDEIHKELVGEGKEGAAKAIIYHSLMENILKFEDRLNNLTKGK